MDGRMVRGDGGWVFWKQKGKEGKMIGNGRVGIRVEFNLERLTSRGQMVVEDKLFLILLGKSIADSYIAVRVRREENVRLLRGNYSFFLLFLFLFSSLNME